MGIIFLLNIVQIQQLCMMPPRNIKLNMLTLVSISSIGQH